MPKIWPRRIGGVQIYEIHGVFADPWVGPRKDEMKQQLKGEPAAGLLFNLREVEKMDAQGAGAILGAARDARKSAVLGQNLSSYFVAEHMESEEKIPIFERAPEVVDYFGKEFGLPTENRIQERRRFPRIKTALPVELEMEDLGQQFLFEGVVTNLSLGGFYAYFLDSRTEELARRKVDPFDLKLVKIRLNLKRDETVEMEGKILRSEKNLQGEPGLSFEFYHLQGEDENKIRAFLNREGEKPEEGEPR